MSQEIISTELFLYKLIIDKGMQDTFPNVAIALRMYLVLMVTNCSAERSFSKLKLTESCLRTKDGATVGCGGTMSPHFWDQRGTWGTEGAVQ